MGEASLKERLLDLLERDKEFRFAVAGLLGYGDILKRLEEHDRKFNEILEELRALREGQAEHARRLEEHDRKFNEIIARLERHDQKFNEIAARLEEHDRKFNEIIARLGRLEREFERVRMRVEVTIGSMGRRWGRDLERTVLEIFREALERRGIEPGSVEKFVRVDEDGSVTGVRGRRVEADVVIRDGRLYILEIKSHATLDDVEWFHQVAGWVQRYLGRKADRLILVAVIVDDDALERAGELGIDVIFGNLIRLAD